MRKYYLDNLRWGTVLLVVVYHVFYLFNAVGIFGGIGSFAPIQYQDTILYFIYPWFMALLFVIAGISARYALEKQSGRDFLRSRTRKLLIPSTLGLLVWHWLAGWLYITVGGGMDLIPPFLRYPIAALSGTGPMWFAQTLWLFSLLLLPIRKLDREGKLYALCGRANLPVLLALAIPVWGSAQVLNLPTLTTYRFGIYFLCFLLGYFVFPHEEVTDLLKRYHLPLLLVAAGLGIYCTLRFFGQNYSEDPDPFLKNFWVNLYLWLAVLALLGCGKAWWDRTSKFAAYMTRTSFGIYVVHFVILLYVGYALKTFTPLPAAAVYALTLAAGLLLSPAVYELLRRVPVVGYLLFGIRKQKG